MSNDGISSTSIYNFTGPIFTQYKTRTDFFSSDNNVIEYNYAIFDDFIIANISAYTQIQKDYLWVNLTLSCSGHEWDVVSNSTNINNFCASSSSGSLNTGNWVQLKHNSENITIISNPSLWKLGNTQSDNIKIGIYPNLNKISFLIKGINAYSVNGVIYLFLNENNINKTYNFILGNYTTYDISYENDDEFKNIPVDYLKSLLLSKGYSVRAKLQDIDSILETKNMQKDWYKTYANEEIIFINLFFRKTNVESLFTNFIYIYPFTSFSPPSLLKNRLSVSQKTTTTHS